MTNSRYVLILFLFYSYNLIAMIDNRFLPLYRRQDYYRTVCKPSFAGMNIFFLIGKKSLNEDGKEIGLPEINGKYDLISETNALEAIGQNPPLITQNKMSPKLDLDLEGKLEGQGVWLGYEQNILPYFYVGLSTYLMHIVSRKNFIIPDNTKKDIKLIKGSENQFDKNLRDTNKLLGIDSFQFSKTGLSDIDLYLRLGTVKDYFYKFRKIDAGISFGTLIPVGPVKDINNPASIPFGGDGHWGLYMMADLNLELKEDLYAGFWFEVSKRLPKNQKKRLPIMGELEEFAPINGEVRINPGPTVGFSPFIMLDDIRDGLGFRFRYTLVYHSDDDWQDTVNERLFKIKDQNGSLQDKLIKTRLGEIVEKSQWAAEYLTFTLSYNFANGATKCRKFAPIVYLEWDRPTKIFIAKNVAKTNRVSFGFEFNF